MPYGLTSGAAMLLQNPTISIIVVASGEVGREAKRAIRSVMSQTCVDFELILVTDITYLRGWIDETSFALRTRLLGANAIRTRSQLRNLALSAARGKFVTEIEINQYFLPGRLLDLTRTWRKECGSVTSRALEIMPRSVRVMNDPAWGDGTSPQQAELNGTAMLQTAHLRAIGGYRDSDDINDKGLWAQMANQYGPRIVCPRPSICVTRRLSL